MGAEAETKQDSKGAEVARLRRALRRCADALNTLRLRCEIVPDGEDLLVGIRGEIEAAAKALKGEGRDGDE